MRDDARRSPKCATVRARGRRRIFAMPAGACAPAASAAPGAEQFIERLSYFMTLVGLTALIIGGAGIANAVSRLRQPAHRCHRHAQMPGRARRAPSSASISTEICIVACSPSPSACAPARWRLPSPRRLLRDILRLPFTAQSKSCRSLTRRGLRLPGHARLHHVAACAHAACAGLGPVPPSHRACCRLAGAPAT